MDRIRYISEDAYEFLCTPVAGPPTREKQRAYNAKAEIYLAGVSDATWGAMQALMVTRRTFLALPGGVQTTDVSLACPDGRCFDLYWRLADGKPSPVPEPLAIAYSDPAYCLFLVVSCLAGRRMPPDVEFVVDERVNPERPARLRAKDGKIAHRYLRILADPVALAFAYPK